MTSYLVVSITSGILFGILDGFLNANPIATRLFEVYKPIARTSVNFAAGIAIDLLYGFVLTALFLLLYPSLPGEAGLAKGAFFALMVWFLRVVMYAASHWMMFAVPVKVLGYTLLAGFVEMFLLGVLYGLAIHP